MLEGKFKQNQENELEGQSFMLSRGEFSFFEVHRIFHTKGDPSAKLNIYSVI